MARNPSGPSLSDIHAKTTPVAIRKSLGDAPRLEVLPAIEARADRAKETARRLHHKFEDRRVAKEGVRLANQHNERVKQYSAPAGEEKSVTPEMMMKQAAQNYEAKTNRRLQKINSIKARMSNALVRTLESGPSMQIQSGPESVHQHNIRRKHVRMD